MTKNVFVSYSHDSNAHKEWVRDLATFLRENGINAILDQWDVEFGDDLAAFMESSITTSDRILAICTDKYIKKANEGQGGVGYEKTICTGEMLADPENRRRFIPVVRNVTGNRKLPTFFGASYFVDLSDGKDNGSTRHALLRAVHEVPSEKPPLGPSPFLAEQSQPQNDIESQPDLPVLGNDVLFEFNKRFAQSFPGLRGVQWFCDPDIISERLQILLRQPLIFKEGHLVWWWRGPANMQIKRFERIDGRHFLMDVEELNISRIAAVNVRDIYYRKYIYVQTNADEPTGLYPLNEEDVMQRVERTGYDYEEFGLVDGTIPVTRPEYDDDAAIIDGRPVDIAGRVELRSRYTTPYNFMIAPNESPINNSEFDYDIESLLNGILRKENQFDELNELIQRLPRIHR